MDSQRWAASLVRTGCLPSAPMGSLLKPLNRLSPILRALAFETGRHAAALGYLGKNDGSIGERAPTEFLSADERAALHRNDGTFQLPLSLVGRFTCAVSPRSRPIRPSSRICWAACSAGANGIGAGQAKTLDLAVQTACRAWSLAAGQ